MTSSINYSNSFYPIYISLICLNLITASAKAQQTLTFEKVDKLSVGVFDMGYCSSDNALFSIGGKIVQGGEIKNTEVIMIYSPYTDEWDKMIFTANDIAVKGSSSSAYSQTDNTIYTLALSSLDEDGQVSYPIEVLDLDNYRLTYDDNNPHVASQAGIAADRDHIYVFGGYSTNEAGEFVLNDELHRYDPRSTEWVQLSRLPEGRKSKGVITNNQLFLIGGETKDGPTTEVLKYDITTDRWSSVGYLPYASDAQAITVSKGYIFALAGNDSTNKLLMINTATNDIDQFNIKFGFEKPGMVVLDEFLYLFGGYAPRSNTANRKTLRIKLSELMR